MISLLFTVRMRIISDKEVMVVAAPTASDFKEWFTKITSCLKVFYSAEALEEKKKTAEALEPIYAHQAKVQLEQYKHLLAVI
jgi:hypothetical protein